MNPARLAVAEARTWIGTPWHHCGRSKGVGVDCAGLVIASLSAGGLDAPDPGRYSDTSDESELLAMALLAVADLVPDGAFQLGDVLLFVRDRAPSPMHHHLAVATGEGGFVHAWSTPSVMSVVETPFATFWSRSLRSVWRPRWPL
ncbi:MAG: C40 family peptidase [Fimbriimonadaceae bacterium]|nr:C40 family peptidase [Fimbriimonadaceae bacterium]QYK58003.1 MAG: C40 family peptidase [Fimbriimonadaceae bacterium]